MTQIREIFILSGVHSFPHQTQYRECAHAPTQESKPYFQPGSLALQKVRASVLGRGNRNLADVQNMDQFLHTGMLENVNSLLALKYAKKCHSYPWRGMCARSVFAGLDHNLSLQDTTQAVTRQGRLQYRLKVSM